MEPAKENQGNKIVELKDQLRDNNIVLLQRLQKKKKLSQCLIEGLRLNPKISQPMTEL